MADLKRFSDFIGFVETLEAEFDVNAIDPRILHAVLGIGGEAGELVDKVKKSISYKLPLDMVSLKIELGDLLHYAAMLISACGWTLDDVLHCNVDKLNKRYPNGFNCEDAIARRDVKED